MPVHSLTVIEEGHVLVSGGGGDRDVPWIGMRVDYVYGCHHCPATAASPTLLGEKPCVRTNIEDHIFKVVRAILGL